MSRVAELLAQLSHEQKVAQLQSVCVAVDAGGVLVSLGAADLRELLADGMGELTRPLGAAEVDATTGAKAVATVQAELVARPPHVPAIVHEECLTGVMAFGATAFPCPLAWGASWDPPLVAAVGDAIRRSMRAAGVHQGLAPVLDVVRDGRWGRVEECIAEDPYLVGLIGCAYIEGLQGDDLRTGVAATGKHFVAHAASEGGRNAAPVHAGPRELADVFLIPFEMAVKLAHVRAVMVAYHEVDGVPMSASRALVTGVLREQWGFDGVVVSDYSAIDRLRTEHRCAASKADAAEQALTAGIDIELPHRNCYEDLPEGPLLDNAVARVLQLKDDLGLLDGAVRAPVEPVDLDPPAHRALARDLARRSVVLLSNDALLPLASSTRLALVGPNAASAGALLGNYTFQTHVQRGSRQRADDPPIVTVADAVGRLGTLVATVPGCATTGDDRGGFAAAVEAATRAQVAVVAVGDDPGHFGTGTTGEGNDTDDLRLPGVQEDLVRAVVATGTPTVVVMISGRPYDLGWISAHAAAVVVAFLPGEEGGTAVADVLYGRCNPSGRLPITLSWGAGQQPVHYDAKPLGAPRYAAHRDGAPVFPFGHGLSYTTYEYRDLAVPPELAVDGVADISCVVVNTGARPGDEVVQLYVRDEVASVTRPARELKGFARVHLDPGEAARVTFALPADMVSFTGPELTRVVEPGSLTVMIGASSRDIRLRATLDVVGATRVVTGDRALVTPVTVTPATASPPAPSRSGIQAADEAADARP